MCGYEKYPSPDKTQKKRKSGVRERERENIKLKSKCVKNTKMKVICLRNLFVMGKNLAIQKQEVV